ncbi:hypothetical protein QTP86_027038 [Hemibagrus guttatus]|nr:hypothetical protein QTP86_027038 [Hemibagrus guttatus]
MTNLQSLSIFLTERLMLAAQEIFKAVEVTVTEYHDEISRSRQENELLKTRLLEAGIPVYPELQPGLSVFHGEPCVGSDRGDPGEKIHVKQEPSVSREELRVPPPQTSVPEEPVSPSVCLDDEQRIEDMLHPQMTDSSSSPLLQAHQCMQIKEESDECKSGLGAEIFCTSQSSTFDDLNSAVASNHTSGLETELDRLSSVHNASESNLYSAQERGDPIKTSHEEIEDFLAVLLFMGVFNFPAMEDYWHLESRFSVIAAIMPRMPLSSKEKSAHHRQRVNSDPKARAEYLAKRKESYQRRKQLGKIKYIKSSDLSKTERKKQRAQWRAASKNYRQRKKVAEAVFNVTPLPMDFILEDVDIMAKDVKHI